MTSSIPALHARIYSLTSAHRQTQSLIQRLQQLSEPSPLPEDDELSQDPDARIEIASDIQSSLKDQEDDFEVLRLDVEDLLPTNGSTAGVVAAAGSRLGVGTGTTKLIKDGERENEKERIVAQVYKLGEDLKVARRSFRRAQLAAKRYADAQRAQERAELFMPPPPQASSDSEDKPPSRPSSRTARHPASPSDRHKHFTQDDIHLTASNDVTSALRRTHTLLENSVSQSQFASETLATSSAALASLSEKYSSLDTVLASSRSLVSSLIRSQKSDTWYLETAFWLCAATLGWLIFRRWIYGPMWWLVWLPLKWSWWAAAGLAGSAPSSVSSVSLNIPAKVLPTMPGTASTGREGIPTMAPRDQGWGRNIPLPAKGGGWGKKNTPPAASSSSVADDGPGSSSKTPMVDKIGEMAERVRDQFVGGGSGNEDEGAAAGGEEEDADAERGEGDEKTGTNVDDISEEERARQEAVPRNPKKRMWEEQDLSGQQKPEKGDGGDGRVRDEL